MPNLNSLRHGGTLGGKKTPEYVAWGNMIARCYNPRNKRYAAYGGRGITVCAEWRHDFARFLADMGPRPAEHSLDRRAANGAGGRCGRLGSRTGRRPGIARGSRAQTGWIEGCFARRPRASCRRGRRSSSVCFERRSRCSGCRGTRTDIRRHPSPAWVGPGKSPAIAARGGACR